MQVSGADSHAAQTHATIPGEQIKEREAAKHKDGAENVSNTGRVADRTVQDLKTLIKEEEEQHLQKAQDVALFDRDGKLKSEKPRSAVDVVV